jgi:hypothetical protein
MTEAYDHDGETIALNEEGRTHILRELADLDAQLQNSEVGSAVWRELTRQRRHLQAELTAGQRLAIPEEGEG